MYLKRSKHSQDDSKAENTHVSVQLRHIRRLDISTCARKFRRCSTTQAYLQALTTHMQLNRCTCFLYLRRLLQDIGVLWCMLWVFLSLQVSPAYVRVFSGHYKCEQNGGEKNPHCCTRWLYVPSRCTPFFLPREPKVLSSNRAFWPCHFWKSMQVLTQRISAGVRAAYPTKNPHGRGGRVVVTRPCAPSAAGSVTENADLCQCRVLGVGEGVNLFRFFFFSCNCNLSLI